MTRQLLVCRGCCCGTDDAETADRRHRALVDAAVDVRFTNCLGPCGERDVVGVRIDGATTWLGSVDDDALLAAVEWLRGRDALAPASLTAHVLDPARWSFTPDGEMTSTDRPV